MSTLIWAEWQPMHVSALASSISATVAVVVAVLTAYFQIKASRRTRLSNSAAMVVNLSKEYNSEEMRKRRQHFATMLLCLSRGGKDLDIALDMPILEFFEDMGYLVRTGVLDKGMVWNSFFWSIKRYFLAITQSTDLLEKAREKYHQQTLYREFEWLHGELSKIDDAENKRPKHQQIAADMVNLFLKDESELVPSEGVK